MDKYLQFFDVLQGANQCEPLSVQQAEAKAAAQQARAQGVIDELTFMGIPHFEAVLQSWKKSHSGHDAVRS